MQSSSVLCWLNVQHLHHWLLIGHRWYFSLFSFLSLSQVIFSSLRKLTLRTSFFFSSTKSSFIRCYTRINCQVTLIGCVWQSVSKPKACPGSLLFTELSSSFHRTVWSWCSSSPKLSLSPPCRSLTETSTILWWAARTAPCTWHVVMEGGSLPPSTVGGETGSVSDPPRSERNCCPLSSQCSTLPPLHLLLIEVSLLPSHPVFLFCLSVMFAKVVHYKQGTHAGGNKSLFSRPFHFSSLCVSVGERVCLRLVIPGRLGQQFHPAMFSFRRISLASQGKKRKCGLNQSFQ